LAASSPRSFRRVGGLETFVVAEDRIVGLFLVGLVDGVVERGQEFEQRLGGRQRR
jgi:hypothetical protein